MIEILAPAGDEQSAYAAINSGADAIYLGLTAFSARSSARNFDFPALENLIAYAHSLGVKIYVAMNTLVKQGELTDFVTNAVRAHNIGADAIIMQDMFLGKYLKRTYPQLHLHLSTQAGVNNVYGARLAKECGFERVILARETALEDIAEIAKIIETEVFVQGALCTCFSGQCYLSSFAGGNSGNRGKCKQPCRKLYSIDRKGFEERAYRLSLSDLSVGTDIGRLIEVGVSSFKIEGRMRRPEYVSAAVAYYRNLIDGKRGDFTALKRTYNRGNYTKGLAFGQDKTLISSAVQGHLGEYCGVIKVINSKYLCQSAEKCAGGDGFKILRDGREICGAVYGGEAKGGFFVSADVRLKNGDKVFITTDVRLNKRLLQSKKIRKVSLSAEFTCGQTASVMLDGKLYQSSFVVQQAQSRPFVLQDFKKCFEKTDAYPFMIEYGDIRIADGCFIPLSALNAFRREVYAKFFSGISDNGNAKIDCVNPFPALNQEGKNRRLAVISRRLSAIRADIGILKLDSFEEDIEKLVSGFDGEKFLFLPVFLSGKEMERIKPIIARFDGIYCDGYYAVELCREMHKKLFAGTGFNVGNCISLKEIRADYIAVSKELTVREAQPLAAGNTFYLTAGDIKVMDLIYCPFGKSCRECDRKPLYTLTDESGRQFALRRYSTDGCRFEIYNCANLVTVNHFTGMLADCTLSDGFVVAEHIGDAEALKKYYTNYTKGHSDTPVF